ncbi:MAG: response regulator transcription factor [Deltaproteobacteria bacterium]|nr:response regulator transcription factor [Deltaproteobacteria bacterium]
MNKKVLIVEDDEAMTVALRDGFEYEGYQVLTAGDGKVGLNLAQEEGPDLILLDVMLPKMTGLDVCRDLRGKGVSTPIIMLTARGQEIDKVLGLRLGADDYVTKPFSFMELLARTEAVLRRCSRSGPEASLSRFDFGDITIDFKSHEATKEGQPLDLSPREFQLMEFFLRHRGEVVTREQLLDSVWGYDTIPFTRTVDTHIAKLRKKIESSPSEPRFLITVHRVGYKFLS